MVTRTTSWVRANESPRYHGVDPEPVTKAPPWIQTITGRRPLSAPGVQTFRVRQSSLISCSCAASIPSSGDASWDATGPNAVASRTPDHAVAGWGALNRSGPTGGDA